MTTKTIKPEALLKSWIGKTIDVECANTSYRGTLMGISECTHYQPWSIALKDQFGEMSIIILSNVLSIDLSPSDQ